jgi:hypothetical protein
MKDSDLRGAMLKAVYDVRRTTHLINFDKLLPPNVPEQDARRILGQLEEKGLIDWASKPIAKLGSGYITAYGTEVIEGDAQPPFTINLNPIIDARVDNSVNRNVTVSGSSGVHVGDVHNVTLDIDKLNIAIDHSKVSEAEKTEAKGLLKRVFENKVVRGVLESWLKSKVGGIPTP